MRKPPFVEKDITNNGISFLNTCWIIEITCREQQVWISPLRKPKDFLQMSNPVEGDQKWKLTFSL